MAWSSMWTRKRTRKTTCRAWLSIWTTTATRRTARPRLRLRPQIRPIASRSIALKYDVQCPILESGVPKLSSLRRVQQQRLVRLPLARLQHLAHQDQLRHEARRRGRQQCQRRRRRGPLQGKPHFHEQYSPLTLHAFETYVQALHAYKIHAHTLLTELDA